MPAQLRRDILVALSIKAVLLTALLVGLRLALPSPATDDAATATAVFGGSQAPPTERADQDRP